MLFAVSSLQDEVLAALTKSLQKFWLPEINKSGVSDVFPNLNHFYKHWKYFVPCKNGGWNLKRLVQSYHSHFCTFVCVVYLLSLALIRCCFELCFPNRLEKADVSKSSLKIMMIYVMTLNSTSKSPHSVCVCVSVSLCVHISVCDWESLCCKRETFFLNWEFYFCEACQVKIGWCILSLLCFLMCMHV